MRQHIYIDTSVFGGYFDDEFCKHTLPLFDRIAPGEFVVLFSSVTQEEIENAPDRVKNLVNIQKIRGYNSTNIKYGYKQLEIRSPREFINYEDK